MCTTKCPNCGHRYGYKLIPLKPQDRCRQATMKTRFEHSVRLIRRPPPGRVKGVFYTLFGWFESWQPIPEPRTEPQVITVEQISADKRHWLLVPFNEAITGDILYTVADACINPPRCNYAGNALKSYGVTSTSWSYLNSTFLDLGYSKPLPNNANGFLLTDDGKFFLRVCLLQFHPHSPTEVSRWAFQEARQQRTATNGNDNERRER